MLIPLTPTDRNRLFEADGVLLPLTQQTEMDFWKIEGVLSGSEGELTPLTPTDRNRLLEAEGVLSPLTPTDRN